MKVFLDTNILLDIVASGRPKAEWSERLFALCEEGLIFASGSILSLANMQYILRKQLKQQDFLKVYNYLSEIVDFGDFLTTDMELGLAMEFGDLEDALQAVTAERKGADYILTWNTRDFKKSHIPAVTPERFFQEIVVGEG